MLVSYPNHKLPYEHRKFDYGARAKFKSSQRLRGKTLKSSTPAKVEKITLKSEKAD